MEVLFTENYPGCNQELFEIRIIDEHHSILTAINLLLEDNGTALSVNVKRYSDPAGAKVTDLIEKAKNTINLITILKRHV